MEKQKYIKLPQYNEIIIFPCVMAHSYLKHLNPISAGFCYINTENKVVECFGESISLNLKSDKEEDTKRATMQVFGVEAFLEYSKLLNHN